MSLSSAPVIGVVFLVGLTIYLSSQPSREVSKPTKGQDLPLPPGPKPLPVLGNVLDMPRKNEWETITKWGKQYGALFQLSSLWNVANLRCKNV